MVVQTRRWNTTALPLPRAHCRWKAGVPTEVTFDGLYVAPSKLKILHVLECLPVCGMADVHHECLAIRRNHLFEIKPVNKRNLCVPAPGLVFALADVIVEWA